MRLFSEECRARSDYMDVQFDFARQSPLFFYSYISVNEKTCIAIRPSPTQSRILTTLKKKSFENIVGKRENAGNQHFVLLPQCLQSFPETNLNFWSTFILSSAKAFNLNLPKILSYGKKFTFLNLCDRKQFRLGRIGCLVDCIGV